MGKTKIITEENKSARNVTQGVAGGEKTDATVAQAVEAPLKAPKKKLTSGILHIEATFNNTKVLFSDKSGNTLFWSTSGSLGFKLGVKDADVVVLGVGSGREPAIRAFMAHGVEVTSIFDATPVPHNGPKAKKPRRV